MAQPVTREELLIALDEGRDVVPGELGLSWCVVATNPVFSRRVAKCVVRTLIADGSVVVVEEFGQVRLRITPKGRAEANGEQATDRAGEDPGVA